jgi:hypothetical protein
MSNLLPCLYCLGIKEKAKRKSKKFHGELYFIEAFSFNVFLNVFDTDKKPILIYTHEEKGQRTMKWSSYGNHTAKRASSSMYV